jgi:hypothetical protein
MKDEKPVSDEKARCHICGEPALTDCMKCGKQTCRTHLISGQVELYYYNCHACWHDEMGDDVPPP